MDWKASYAPRAAVNYKIWLERLIEVCGEKELQEFTIMDVVNYRKFLEGKFNSYSVQYAIIIVKNFFQFYKNQDYICLNPSLIKLPRIVAKSHRAVSEQEFESVLSEIPKSGFASIRDQLIICMLWDTGVRVSELTDLDVSQINENRHNTIITTKKTGLKRTIMWSKMTHELLLKYMALRINECSQTTSHALFLGWKQGTGWYSRLTTRTVERIIKKYVGNAKILERITPHSFRHGWAHKRRDQNAPLAFIQRGLGHVSPVSTFVYEQYKDVEFEKCAKKYLT
ncbi:MAG: tyrosine-type recombinase/integrase [Bacteroidota bacterium]|nr:tyrosine-type recombinase/integrase [Bacteroidota bacterium]